MRLLSPFTYLCLAVASTFVATVAYSQVNSSPNNATQLLQPVVVTASRSQQPLDQVIGDVTVIDGVQLRENSAITISQLLRKQPSIQIYENGGPQTVSGIFVRGASPSQTLVMINGIRINDSLNGGVNWAALNPSAFERVEIVRGAASSLYGSNAMGGAINLINELPAGSIKPFAMSGNIGFGSHSTVKTNAGFSAADGQFDYRFNGTYTSSHGYNATNPDAGFAYNPDDDGYTQASVDGSFGWTWAPEQRLGLSFFNGYNNGDFDSGTFDNNIYGISRQQIYSFSSSNQVLPWWQSVLRFGFSKGNNDIRLTSFPSESQSIQRLYTWQNNFKLTDNQFVSLVMERNEEIIRSLTAYDQHKRHTNSIGLIYQGHFDRHHLQASLRNDNYSGYGNKVTGSLAYDFDITKEISAGVGTSTGFRTPTFNDLYYSADAFFKGNLNLKPEKSSNIEAHISYTTDNITTRITAFQSKYKNLINTYDCSNFFCSTSNTELATIRGISLNSEYHLGSTHFNWGADFLSPKDDRTNKVLPRRAKQVFRAGITQELGRFEIGVDYLFVGKRYDDVSNTDAKHSGGYGILNLRGSIKISKTVSAQLYLNNVLNKQYANPYGYRTPGSEVFLNLSWQQ